MGWGGGLNKNDIVVRRNRVNADVEGCNGCLINCVYGRGVSGLCFGDCGEVHLIFSQMY